jgi:hypothetical protein
MSTYAAALGMLMLWAGPRDEPLLYLLVVVFWVWGILPPFVSLLIGYGFRRETATSAWMVLTTVGMTVYGGYACFSAFLLDNLSSTSGLAFVFVPILQWLGLAAALVVVCLVWLILKLARR